jgi:hypothetical protein
MNTQSTFLKLFACGAFFAVIVGSARGDEKHEPEKKILSRRKAPPTYVRNEKDDSKWPGIVRDGIDAAREYFGNYGPVYVYILGHKDKALNSEDFHRELVASYCRHRCGGARRKLRSCKDGPGTELVKKALSGRGDAYLSFVDATDPPIAELVFINPHEFRDPYLYTRGIHEYTHVFQRSFPTTPTWMTEGGAEFFAAYLGEKHGWEKLRDSMKEFMKNVHRVEDPARGIEDMEDVDKAPPGVKKYYRHLAYDAGAWAFAFMIHKSKGRSIADTRKILYPLVAKHGWESALVEFAQVDDKKTFYRAFRDFLKTPLEAQLKMLETLED